MANSDKKHHAIFEKETLRIVPLSMAILEIFEKFHHEKFQKFHDVEKSPPVKWPLYFTTSIILNNFPLNRDEKKK